MALLPRSFRTVYADEEPHRTIRMYECMDIWTSECRAQWSLEYRSLPMIVAMDQYTLQYGGRRHKSFSAKGSRDGATYLRSWEKLERMPLGPLGPRVWWYWVFFWPSYGTDRYQQPLSHPDRSPSEPLSHWACLVRVFQIDVSSRLWVSCLFMSKFFEYYQRHRSPPYY